MEQPLMHRMPGGEAWRMLGAEHEALLARAAARRREMMHRPIFMAERKRIALIAHDNCKADLLDWARFNHGTLLEHTLFATGTTGDLLAVELGLTVVRFRSGPLGGDQQVGASIVDGGVDSLIFFWDPLEPHPHDVDVRALLRIAVVYNVPIACNRATADFLLSSPLMRQEYWRLVPNYGERYDGERYDGKRYDGEHYESEHHDGERYDSARHDATRDGGAQYDERRFAAAGD